MRVRLVRVTHEVTTPGEVTVFVYRHNAVRFYRMMRRKYRRDRVALHTVYHGRGIYTAFDRSSRLL